MFYPQRPDYPCETCHKGTKRWRGVVFSSTYVLGYHHCDNPDCPNSAEAQFNLAKFQENMKKRRKTVSEEIIEQRQLLALTLGLWAIIDSLCSNNPARPDVLDSCQQKQGDGDGLKDK